MATKTQAQQESPEAVDAVNNTQPDAGEQRATAAQEAKFLAGEMESGKSYRYQTIGGESVLLVSKVG